ncbi:MAG: UDP-glucose 4-epimerase GalE [Acholeplasmatales bacterium]|jgi:UDP-glucose 4-epimerase|nr:UDP-glucose 4-epimerase GalE [Acholeplasmatales bacterium]
MKVLVVGGAGYIGSHTVYELIRAGHECIVFDNLSTGYKDFVHPNAKFYFGDVRNYKDLENVLKKEENISCVMHFAAKIIVPESVSIPLEYYSNNVEGVRVLLEIVRDFKIKHFVFSSTAAVYGEPETGICLEDNILNPINPYGETKLACEKMIKWASEAYNFTYIIFRYFNVAGADSSLKIGLFKDQITHLIPIAVQAAIGIREELLIYGNDYPTKDGTCIRDYIHVSDLAKAHVSAAIYLEEKNKSETMNLGSSNGYSVLEVADTVNNISSIKYRFTSRRAGDPAILMADSSKARRLLNFKPLFSLEDMIKSDIAFRRNYKCNK